MKRGYSLVEMMIALVVLGILVGGALVPLNNRLERRQVETAKNTLQEAKEAVLGYALQNQTSARRLLYYDGVEYTLPAGRPYMPCPDIDNDGIEDRVLVPITVGVIQSRDLSIENYGECVQQKGLLPWRTLGVSPTDPWGNRLTYRVANTFSDSLFGFDETVRADIFNRRADLTFPLSGFTEYSGATSASEHGNVVCSALSGLQRCPDVGYGNVLAGVFAESALTLGSSLVPAGGLLEGAVFVILSHGSNGFGAVGASGVCHAPPTFTNNNLMEVANSFYETGHPIRGLCAAPASVPSVGLSERVFVQAPSSSVDSLADDMLVWGGANEIFGALLQGGVLPIERLVFWPEL